MVTASRNLITAAIWLGAAFGASAPALGQVTPILPKPLALPPPPGLKSTGDSAALITAVVRQSLDTLLAISGADDPAWLRLPPGPIWNDLYTLIRADIQRGTLAGWCQTDGIPCPGRKHRQVTLGWSEVLNPDTAVLFIWDVEEAPLHHHRPVPPPSTNWMFWRLAEVGIWPSPPVVGGGLLRLITPTRILMTHTATGWRTQRILPTTFWDECQTPTCISLGAGKPQ